MADNKFESVEDVVAKPGTEASAAEAQATEPIPQDPEELRAEVERLRAENDKLSLAATPSTFWRNASAGLLIVIGVLVFSMAISALWLNRTVMDENRWVDTVAPLAQDTAIQDYVAATASSAIFNAVDIQSYVQKALTTLPPQAQFLAAPITGAIQTFVRDAATKFVRSPQFPELWTRMNRLAHKAFIASIAQTQGQLVNNQNGKITLDVSVLADQMKQTLSDRGLTFVNNISIPAAGQQIVLIDSPALGQFATLIQWMSASAYVLPLLALLLLGGGVAIAANRRKAVLWLGIGIIIVTMLPLQAIYFGQIPFAKAAYALGQMPNTAAQHAYTIVFRNLVKAEQLAAILGLVLVIGATVAGPGAWAVALRQGLQKGINNVGPDWDFGPAGEWVYLHASGMRTAGVIVALVALLVWPAKSVATIVWFVVVVLAWLVLVALFGRPRPVRTPADSAESAGGDPPSPQAA